MISTLCLCAHRHVSLQTMKAMIDLLGSGGSWSAQVETGDALICRARSTAASEWLRHAPDSDVLVMTDDDFYFTVDGINALAAVARETRGIAAGVTPLRSGEYTAIVPLVQGLDEPWRDPRSPVQEIRWAGGLLAYHRSVFEELVPTLPFLHAQDRIKPFWPFFQPFPAMSHGQAIYLSEDYACHERARAVGKHVYVVPACQVTHQAEIDVTTQTMDRVRALVSA